MQIDINALFGMLPKIKIISIPKGDAPVHIKEKWIGVEIPCIYSDLKGLSMVGSVLSDKLVRPYASFVVYQVHAITALLNVCPEAAIWWKEHGFPESSDSTFVFSAESVFPLEEICTREDLFGGLN